MRTLKGKKVSVCDTVEKQGKAKSQTQSDKIDIEKRCLLLAGLYLVPFANQHCTRNNLGC